jgi:hypothetical protein
MMEGEKENDLFKNTFPLPRQHSPRTRLFPLDDFQDVNMQQASRRTDLLAICKDLINQERFADLAKIIITYKCIGRGGEVKFLSYHRMFFDETYCMLFQQWFQRKNLKSTPSAMAVEFEHPELCGFLALGLFWACENGLGRPHTDGFPTPAQAHKFGFVFQDLHDINDASVARQLSNIIKGIVPPQLKDFYSIKSA